jgi:hypothetical protein
LPPATLADVSKRKRQTAEEFIAELQRDRGYLETVRLRDERIAREEADLGRAEQPLVAELRAAGAAVESVWDLVNTKERYPQLVPILLAHLRRDYPKRIREGIARALAVPEARAGWDQLVRAFLAEDGPIDPVQGANEMKWCLHLAVAAAADGSVLDELIGLVADRRHGPHRSLFVDALARMSDPRARAALEELRGDPDLAEAFKRLDKRRRRR